VGTTVHELTTVHPDRKLPVSLVEEQFGVVAGYSGAVEEFPGDHDRLGVGMNP
jgi:hypothetical protein